MNRRVTIADVAQLAGVSASTASVVFSGKIRVAPATAERVRAAAEQLGYLGPDPRAASLRTGRSGIIGVVISASLRTAFLDPVAMPTLEGLASKVADIGAGILLLRTDGSTPAATEVPIDAAVIFGSSPEAVDTARRLRERGIPVVWVEGHEIDGSPLISLDNRAAQATIARHLHDLGHRNVGVVTLRWAPGAPAGFHGPGEQPAIDVTSERLDGVLDVFDNPVVFSAATSSVTSGIEAAHRIFERARPTAIIAQSDLLAAGVVRAALERGLTVPNDLSVTGFDGVAVDGLAPYELTTMHQPAYEKGRAVGEAIARQLAGEEVASIRFACTFRKGNTAAKAPVHPLN